MTIITNPQFARGAQRLLDMWFVGPHKRGGDDQNAPVSFRETLRHQRKLIGCIDGLDMAFRADGEFNVKIHLVAGLREFLRRVLLIEMLLESSDLEAARPGASGR